MASQQMQAFLDAKRDAPPKKQVVPTEETRRELDDYMSDQPAADGFNLENVIIGDCPARRFTPETGLPILPFCTCTAAATTPDHQNHTMR